MVAALRRILNRGAVVAAALACMVALLFAPSPAGARDELTRAEVEAAIESARQEISRLSELRRQSPDDPEIRTQLLDQYRTLGSAADDFGGAYAKFNKADDFQGWIAIAQEVAADEPADVTRQLDVLDALFTFAAYEWDARPSSENWLDHGRDGLALVRQLREAARDDVRLRTALGERLKAFPGDFVTCRDRCTLLDEEVLAAMAAMADDALDDPIAQLTHVAMVRSAALRSGQENLATTVDLLERSIALAPRIAEPDWRKGALVRSYFDLQMLQRNGGHAAAADAAVTGLVAALSALEPAGALNGDDRWCLARLRDPATRENATDSCFSWAMTSGVPCFAADPWNADRDVALASAVYRTSRFLFAGLQDGTPTADLLGTLLDRALHSNPYCPQVRYYLSVAVNMLGNLIEEDPGIAGAWPEETPVMLFINCAPFEQDCSRLRERALSVFRSLADREPRFLSAYLKRLLVFGSLNWRGPSNAWGERLLLEHRALSPRLEGVDRDIATRDGALVLAAILNEQDRSAEARELVAEAVRMARLMAERDPAFADQANACSLAAEGWPDLAAADLNPCMDWPKGGSMGAR